MLIKQFKTGGDRNFGYLIADEGSKKAVVVDPSFSPERIVDFARERGYRIVYVFVTHDHFDHTNGNAVIERLTGVRPLLYGETDRETGIRVEDGASFPIGELEVRILHTPGHTEDSICLHIGDAVFTGDTLFVGKVGGTDYDAGAWDEYASLHEKLLALPDATRVFPGHDYGTSPDSTIGKEKKTNPFLFQPDFEAFVGLKRNWLVYKKEHGIA
jgi:glyoxylase-like metal-dependent hydrolase (beta-lactamase superfamily II)